MNLYVSFVAPETHEQVGQVVIYKQPNYRSSTTRVEMYGTLQTLDATFLKDHLCWFYLLKLPSDVVIHTGYLMHASLVSGCFSATWNVEKTYCFAKNGSKTKCLKKLLSKKYCIL